MKNSKIIFYSILNALSTLLYIIGVAWLMFNGESLFGKMKTFWGPAMLLLLFVLSATIVGLLVLGRPIYLYLNNFKQYAIRLLFYTIGWLLTITLITFAVAAVK